MRKNLLASAAMLGTLVCSSMASAQVSSISNLASGASAPSATSDFPTAGTVVVRLGGLVDWYAVGVSDSGDRSTKFGPGGAGPSPAFKQANYTFGDYIRLFPTVDGVAANGLRYGVYSEIRVENFLNTGGGANASVSGTDRTNNLYIRRAYLYFGLQNAGYIRLGTGDGAGGLFDTGTFQNFDQGGWNGDVPNLISGNAQVVFPFQGGVGNFYATNKLTYLSPQIAGFELGLSYEPNTSNVTDYNVGTVANSNAVRLDASSVAGDLHRRRNVINPEVRYRATFGPVGVAAEAGYYLSGVVSNNAVSTPNTVLYKGWNFYDGGLVLTFGGLSVGGHVMEGDFNGQGGLAPQGASKSLAWIGGASYTVGPVIVGASYFHYNFPGSQGIVQTPQGRLVGSEHDSGIAAGGTYTVIPGVSLFLSYVYGERKENGYDLLNGAPNVAGSNQGNQTRAQALGIGTQIRW